jgi:Mg2+-importing ATPase
MPTPPSRPPARGQASAAAAPFWAGDEAGLLEALGARREGLTADEAARRLAAQGPNRLEPAGRTDALRLLARQFESPLVLILLFGAVLSLGLREWVDAGIVLVIVIGSALLGFVQEHRASRAVEALQRRIAPTARVRRGGEVLQVPAASLVTGDVVLLSAGNLVPADGRVLEALDCLVEEASLTGESFPVDKRPGAVPVDAPQGARRNAVFVGTSVRSGTAVVLVAATGRATQYGAVAARLAARAPSTGFERGVRDFGTLLMRVMVLMVLFVLVVNHALGRPGIESLMFAVALAVGLSPELLPAIVSVTLSHGARAMAARGTIVRRLQSIENLGGMDLLCTDKTGTLTEGRIALAAAVDADGGESAAVLRLAWLNASFEAGIDNPLDAAVVAAGLAAGLDTGAVTKVAEMPYDFVRRRLTVVVADPAAPGRHRLVTKGAVDNVLAVCTQVAADGGELPLDAPRRERLRAWCAERGAQGLRVLAVAGVERDPRAGWGRDDEAGLVLAGFLLFRDPPRPDAAQAILALAALGIGTRMITGDNRWVAAHLAREVGLDPEALLTGEEIAGLDDAALRHRAARTQVFAEIDPQQKERIVRALRAAGHVVGYLGDGINDAPALHAADVGISVDGAVDVARESADVVLLQRDLGVLHDGVVEGRRTFANTMKYIEITTSANFGNMVSMAIATPLLPFLPLTATQILLNNFLSDLPAMAIATDRVDAAHLAVPQRWDIDALRRFMLAFGLLSTLFDLAAFVVLRRVFGADAATFQTGWFVVSLLTELAVLLILRTHGPVHRSVPGRLLLVATVVVACVAIALPVWPPAAALFGFVALAPAALASVLAVVGAYAVATEVGKRRFRAAHAPAVAPPA